MKIACISLGCPKNQVDLDVMVHILLSAGHETVADLAEADVILVNTCGFIESAKTEAIENILEACAYKQQNPNLKVIVTGCLAERYRSQIEEEIPEVDAVVGCASNKAIDTIVERLFHGENHLESYGAKKDFPLGGKRVIGTPAHYAYLKIAEGCNNRCHYCAIPGIRGPLHSRDMADCVAEARWLAGEGVKELIIVAQDPTAYGEDWDGFKELVEKSDIKDKNLILQVLSLYNSPAERETEIKNMSTVFEELKKEVLPELRRSQIVNSTDLQGLTDAEIMAAYRNGGELTVEQYLYAAQELAKNADEQVAILTAASKKFNDARVWNNLGVAQTQAGDKAAALKSFEKAAKLDSSKELSKNLLLANLANGNTAEAKKYAAAAEDAEQRPGQTDERRVKVEILRNACTDAAEHTAALAAIQSFTVHKSKLLFLIIRCFRGFVKRLTKDCRKTPPQKYKFCVNNARLNVFLHCNRTGDGV